MKEKAIPNQEPAVLIEGMDIKTAQKYEVAMDAVETLSYKIMAMGGLLGFASESSREIPEGTLSFVGDIIHDMGNDLNKNLEDLPSSFSVKSKLEELGLDYQTCLLKEVRERRG